MDKQPVEPTKIRESQENDLRHRPFETWIYEEKGDPECQAAIVFVKEHINELVTRIMQDEDLWKMLKEYPIIGKDIEIGEYTIHVTLHFVNKEQKGRIEFTGMKTAWLQKREAELYEIFREKRWSGRQSTIGEIATRLPNVSKKELSIVNVSFDPDRIKDNLGRGLDIKIIELIRIMNMTGIKTSMSCAGHPKSKNGNARLPFLYIQYESFPQFMQVIVDWGLASDLICFPVGRDGVYFTFAPGTPLKKAQRVFGELTDFLARKIHHQHESTLTPVEIQQRTRRQIGR